MSEALGELQCPSWNPHDWRLWSREWKSDEIGGGGAWAEVWYCTRCRGLEERQIKVDPPEPAPDPYLWQTWRLDRVEDDQMIVLLYVPQHSNFEWIPVPGQEPKGLVRWYVQEVPDAEFVPYGDPFSYEEAR